MERLLRRPEVNGVSAEEAEFVFTQAMYLGKMVRDLNLGEIYVNPIIEVKDRAYFNNRKTLAYTGISDLTVATVASSGAERGEEAQVTTMLIAPTKKGSGILVDDKTGTVYTDSFWVCENGVLKYVKPTSPVSIDGLCTIFDSGRTDRVIDPLTEPNKAFFELTDNKQRTKEVLAKAGIQVPRGIFLTPMDNVEEKIDTFAKENPDIEGLVMKENNGAQGKGVSLVPLHELKELREFVSDMIYGGYGGAGIIIEERIVPPARLLKVKAKNIDGLDYNFRVITTLDRENPHVIDAEIRFKIQNGRNTPVNICLDAKATRIGAFYPALIERIYRVAEEATKALCQEVLKPGEKILGIAGIDLMIDRSGSVYVIEANGGPVGGFGTLVKLDRKPLDSIKNVLAPATMPYLEDQFAKRGVADSRTLRRLPNNVNDFSVLFEMMFFAKKYDEAIRVLGVAKAKIPDQWEYILNGMIWIGIKTENFDYALRYVDEFLLRDPKNLFYTKWKLSILRACKRYQDEKEILDNFSEEERFSHELFWEAFFLTLGERKEEEAFAMLKDFWNLHGFEYSYIDLCKNIVTGYKVIGDRKRWLIWKARLDSMITKNKLLDSLTTQAGAVMARFFND